MRQIAETARYPVEVNPYWIGVYKVDTGHPRPMFAHWDGRRWGRARFYPHDAAMLPASHLYQNKGITGWRGLVLNPYQPLYVMYRSREAAVRAALSSPFGVNWWQHFWLDRCGMTRQYFQFYDRSHFVPVHERLPDPSERRPFYTVVQLLPESQFWSESEILRGKISTRSNDE